MRLRRWCVSQTNEPLRFFWTLGGAEREYWRRDKFAGARDRMGLFRWDGSTWIRQEYTLVDVGRQKFWIDARGERAR